MIMYLYKYCAIIELYNKYRYIVIVIAIFICRSHFIPPRNLDEVFTYNHMVLISLRSRSHVKTSMVLTRTNHL